jgi:hypothetical protein
MKQGEKRVRDFTSGDQVRKHSVKPLKELASSLLVTRAATKKAG